MRTSSHQQSNSRGWKIVVAAFALVLSGQSANAQGLPEFKGPESELTTRFAAVIPSVVTALRGDNVEAQRAALAVIPEIPIGVSLRANLADTLAGYIEKTKSPELQALAIRAYGKSAPGTVAASKIFEKATKSPDAAVRRAAGEGLYSVVKTVTPQSRSVWVPAIANDKPAGAYFADSVVVLSDVMTSSLKDADPETNKFALDALTLQSRAITEAFSPDTFSLRDERRNADPDEMQKRWVLLSPVLRSFVNNGDSVAALINSKSPEVRSAAVLAAASLGQLRKAVSQTVPASAARDDLTVGIAKKFIGALSGRLKDPAEAGRTTIVEAIEPLAADFDEAKQSLIVSATDVDTFVRWTSARALSGLIPAKTTTPADPAVLTALGKLTNDADIDVRMSALSSLQKFGIAAKPISAAVAESASKGDIEARAVAVKALTSIQADAAIALPVLIAGLQESDLRMRRAAATALTTLKAEAKPALGELRKALETSDPELRLAATEAILSIEQSAAPKQLR
jgi:hypothetical protein